MNLNTFERVMLASILKAYKKVIRNLNQAGLLEKPDGLTMSAREIIQMADYFIEKVESPDKDEVNLDELLDRRNL